MAKRAGLGPGAARLLGETPERPKAKPVKKVVKEKKTPETAAESNNSGETYIRTTLIEPNKEQPRKNFNEDELREMADSIKQHGIIQPLIVVKKGKNYQLIAGERRWRAARLAGLKEVPVLIRDYTPQEKAEIALIENLQRSDLNPVEEAMAYKQLIEQFSLTQEDVATRVSRSRSAVTNSLRLLNLSEEVLDMLAAGTLTTGHARPLLAIDSAEIQTDTAKLIVSKKMSVRETEKFVKRLLAVDPKDYRTKEEDDKADFLYKEAENNLKNVLGAKVRITESSKNKGKIEIAFSSSDEFDNIINLLYNAK